jgi:pyridoxal biosynthesis lyase PdxS
MSVTAQQITDAANSLRKVLEQVKKCATLPPETIQPGGKYHNAYTDLLATAEASANLYLGLVAAGGFNDGPGTTPSDAAKVWMLAGRLGDTFQGKAILRAGGNAWRAGSFSACHISAMQMRDKVRELVLQAGGVENPEVAEALDKIGKEDDDGQYRL